MSESSNVPAAPLISPFLLPTAPPVIADPYGVPLADLNPVDGRLFEHDLQGEHFRRLREEDPVHFNEMPGFGRYWSITKYADILDVDTNHELYSSAHGIALGPSLERGVHPDEIQFSNFIAMDPPKHGLQRRTVSDAVAPPNLALLEPLIRSRVQAILDDLPRDEPFDWVPRVSIELTTQMLATLFDFPFEDRYKLTRWSDVATAAPGTGIIDSAAQRKQELMECLAYFTKLWQERAAWEKPGNDLLSMMAHGEFTKDMEPHELLGNLILLIVGGNDTTRNSISGGVLALHEFPEQREKLYANPSLIPSMVSEVIRWHTPLPYMRRTATVDTEVRGKEIKQGDQVLMWYISGNRDPEAIEDPDAFIIDRKNPRRHLSFGFGIHRCMGNRLAEMQLRILWEEIVQRFSYVEPLGEPTRLRSSFIRGITSMPVRLHAI